MHSSAIFKMSAALLLSVATALGTPLAYASSSASTAPQTVSQGDHINVRSGSCQVGYVDPTSHTFYIARHCVETTKSGEIIYKNNRPVGFTHDDGHPGTEVPYSMRNDVIAIHAYPTVKLGANQYSTDTFIPYGHINIGDKACARSHMSNRTVCGNVVEKANATITIATDEPLRKGDSGGPAWIVDDSNNPQGLIGVFSYHYTIPVVRDGKEVWLSTFTSISDLPCDDEAADTKRQGCGLRPDGPYQLAPATQQAPDTTYTSSEYKQANNDLSSALKRGDTLNEKQIGTLVSLILTIGGAVMSLAGIAKVIATHIRR